MKKRKENYKLIVYLLITAIIVIVMFVELFCKNIIGSNIHIKLIHHKNRSDLLMFINIILSSIISYGIYNLSKRINEQTEIDKRKKRYQSICAVYDYLNEVILYIKKQTFKEKEDYRKLLYSNDFMRDVYSLNGDLFDETDILYMRSLNYNLKNYLNINDKNRNDGLSIKWVYKSIFDLSIEKDDIERINDLVDNDMLLNVQLVHILSKLRKELNYTYIKRIKYKKIELNIETSRNTIIVIKRYKSGKCIVNGKGCIDVYEPLFQGLSGDIKCQNGGIIYTGNVDAYKFNGNGRYFYHADKEVALIDSYNLIEDNAKKVKKILENNGIDTKIEAEVCANFIGGIMNDGIIKLKGKEDKKIKF